MIKSKNAWERYHTLKDQLINSITDKLNSNNYIQYQENSFYLTTQEDYLVTALSLGQKNEIRVHIDNNSGLPVTFGIKDERLALADFIKILESIEESI